MKTAIILLFILFTACGYEIKPIIVFKSYRTFSGKKMPECICRYGYMTKSVGSMIEFEDSCNKYEIRDTIRPHRN